MIDVTGNVALVMALVGPFLTYAGVRYQQRDKLETLARQLVEETLRRQQGELDALRKREEKTEGLLLRLRKAYVSMRESLITITSRTRELRQSFDHFFEVRADARREEEAIDEIDRQFDHLLAALDGLAEDTDPLSSKPGLRAVEAAKL